MNHSATIQMKVESVIDRIEKYDDKETKRQLSLMSLYYPEKIREYANMPSNFDNDDTFKKHLKQVNNELNLLGNNILDLLISLDKLHFKNEIKTIIYNRSQDNVYYSIHTTTEVFNNKLYYVYDLENLQTYCKCRLSLPQLIQLRINDPPDYINYMHTQGEVLGVFSIGDNKLPQIDQNAIYKHLLLREVNIENINSQKDRPQIKLHYRKRCCLWILADNQPNFINI